MIFFLESISERTFNKTFNNISLNKPCSGLDLKIHKFSPHHFICYGQNWDLYMNN